MVTMDDIAKKVGVSKGTVSKALNGAPDVSDALRKTILETAVALGYTRARRGAVRSLCILIENMSYSKPEDFGTDIVTGFRQMAEPSGYGVRVVELTKELQQSVPYDTFMLREGYLGALVLGMSLNDAGTLVSNFWMSYMVGMWAFSFILRFFDLQRILTVLAGLAAILMYVFNTGTPAHMAWSILALGFFSSAIYTTIITLGSQQTKVPSPKLVNFVLTCGTIGTMLTFVVTGPIVEHSGPQAALLTANGLYAVVFVMCFLLGFVSRHRQHNTLTSH